MSKSLAGKVAIVTGSGQGVGRGIALFFAREGAAVITNNRKPGSVSASGYRREEIGEEEYKKILAMKGDAESTARKIRGEGGVAEPFYGDVAEYEIAKQMVDFALKKFGHLDILVNNAAGLGQGSILSTTESDWEYMTIAKLKGAYNLMHHAVPIMMEQRFGRILNCASDAWTGTANLAAYSAANAGVVGLTKAVAQEVAAYNITVNACCPQAASPGHVVEFNKTVQSLEAVLGDKAHPSEEKMRQIEEDHGDPVHVAPFLAYLCTDEADYISGSVFSVKASGVVDIYSEPLRYREITRTGSEWSMEELRRRIPEELLYDYSSRAKVNKWK